MSTRDSAYYRQSFRRRTILRRPRQSIRGSFTDHSLRALRTCQMVIVVGVPGLGNLGHTNGWPGDDIMELNTIRTSIADADWMADFFRAADTFSVSKLTAWFADDVEIRFGNAPPIRGKVAAEEAFTQFYSGLSGMRHRAESRVVDGPLGAQMSIVTYVRKDGSEVSMPVASHLRRVGNQKIDRLWIFIDMAPLFAAA